MRQFQFEGVPDRARSDAVINWMFDVDEDDEYDFETPLLEELEIDIGYITRFIHFILFLLS